MKKVLFVIFMIGTFLLLGKNIYAESFIEGNFINGEYITKDKGNTHLYVTMQFIKTTSGEIVYCLEPFITFFPSSSYDEIVGDLYSYSKLSDEQIKRIELLSYYGYGYKNRTDNKWYVITQYLIWKTVDKEATFSFTSTLNGTKINKYEAEIAEIEKDILNRENFTYSNKFTVNYAEDLDINFLNKDDYVIISSDYKYVQDSSGVKINELKENGSLSFSRIGNYYKDKVRIYSNSSNQDLIKPGNINEDIYNINIVVQKGRLTLNILKDESVYTVESEFSNTCYEINGEKIETISVCTGDDEMTYISDYLPYGDYEIKQISNGVGYLKDENIYKFTINASNTHPVVTVNNLLLRNTIDILKFACKDDICEYEKNAVFSVLDKNGNIVDNIVTANNGKGSLLVGYGLYYIKQEKGLDSYTVIERYSENIVDETSSHSKVLYNNYISKIDDVDESEDIEVIEELEEPEELDETEELEKIEEEIIIEPPKTSVDISFIQILLSVLFEIIKLLIVI